IQLRKLGDCKWSSGFVLRPRARGQGVRLAAAGPARRGAGAAGIAPFPAPVYCESAESSSVWATGITRCPSQPRTPFRSMAERKRPLGVGGKVARYLISFISELTFSPLGFRWAHQNARRSVARKQMLPRCWRRKSGPNPKPVLCRLCGIDMGREGGAAHAICTDYANIGGEFPNEKVTGRAEARRRQAQPPKPEDLPTRWTVAHPGQ